MKKNPVPKNMNFTAQDADGKVIEFTDYYVIYQNSYDETIGEMRHNPTEYKISPEQYNAPNSKYKYNPNQEEFYLRIRD